MKTQIIIIVMIFLTACRANNKKTIQDDSNLTESKITTNDIFQNNAPVQVVTDFLKWYKKNHDTIMRYNLINNTISDKYDPTKFYSVDFDETEKYLAKLKSSGLVSDKYLNSWRTYFLEHGYNFKKNPQNVGPPAGFEYDFILLTQDIDETLKSIDSLKVIDVTESKDSSIVKIDIMMRLGFHLSRDHNKWLIDRIENIGIIK